MKSGGFHAKDFGSDEKIQHSVVDHVILYICIGSEEKSTIYEIRRIS